MVKYLVGCYQRIRQVKVLEMKDIDLMDIIDISAISEPLYSDFYKNCLAYISGNVVRVIGPKLKCENCVASLLNNADDLLPIRFAKLIKTKDRGGLFTPSHSVYRIVEMADACYRQLSSKTNGLLKTPPNLDRKISMMVMSKCLTITIFPHMKDHIIDFDPLAEKSHLSDLIDRIVMHFLKIGYLITRNGFKK